MSLPALLTVKDNDQDENNFNVWREIQRMQGQEITIADTGVAADTDFTVNHTLGYVPEAIQVLVYEDQSNAYLAIRPGTVAWTKTTVSLQANTANANIKIVLR